MCLSGWDTALLFVLATGSATLRMVQARTNSWSVDSSSSLDVTCKSQLTSSESCYKGAHQHLVIHAPKWHGKIP